MEGGIYRPCCIDTPSKHKLAVRTNHDITNTVTNAILIGVTLYGLNEYARTYTFYALPLRMVLNTELNTEFICHATSVKANTPLGLFCNFWSEDIKVDVHDE